MPGHAKRDNDANIATCFKCGERRRLKFVKNWTYHGTNWFCGSCWTTFQCGECGHTDTGGQEYRGKWTCRQCQHRHRFRGIDQRHEEFQLQIIEEGEENEEEHEENGTKCEHLALQSVLDPWKSDAILGQDDCSNISDTESTVASFTCVSGTKLHASAHVLKEPPRAGHIILLLDASGSMRTVDAEMDLELRCSSDAATCYVSRLDAVAACAAEFINAHAKQCPMDEFSVIIFNDGTEIVAEAQNARAACTAIGQMPLRGSNGTFYKPALEAAKKLVTAVRPRACSHVIILSDGRPADPKDALRFFQQECCCSEDDAADISGRALDATFGKIHGIGFGTSVSSFAALQQLASISGGSFALSAKCSVRGLRNAFSSVSSTITSAGGMFGGPAPRVARTPRCVTYELPEMGDFGRRNVFRFKASRKAFRYTGEDFKEEPAPATEVARRVQPHLRGGMRLVYGFRDPQVVREEGSWMVAKCSRFVDSSLNTREVVEAHAKSTAVARFYAAKYNRQLRRATAAATQDHLEKVKHPALVFVQCFAYVVEAAGANRGLPDSEPTHFAAERFLPGAFLKYNSNNGYIDEGVAKHSETVQALSHFTFEASCGKLMVADLQGVARDSEVLLTDPQVLSRDAAFGPGDLGPEGMWRCLTQHRCGPTCRSLGLTPVAASTLRGLRRHLQSGSGGLSSGMSANWELLSEASTTSWECIEKNNHCQYDVENVSKPPSASSWMAI